MAADALSRIHTLENQHFVLSMENFKFLEQLRLSLQDTQEFCDFLHRIQDNPSEHTNFSVSRGLIFCKRKIWLPQSYSFIPLLLNEFHSTPLGGHLGVAKTLRRLQDNFFWASIRGDVRDFVS